MQKPTIKKLLVQTRFLNSLLSDPQTPAGKIKIEMIMLNHMLENSEDMRTRATDKEIKEVYHALKRARQLIEENTEKLEG